MITRRDKEACSKGLSHRGIGTALALVATVLSFPFSLRTSHAAETVPQPTIKQENGGKTMSRVTVRYIVNDVEAAMSFYAKHLDFTVETHPAPGFAMLSRGNLWLLLNMPGAGGAGQGMPDGRKPEPGGWNRIQIEVPDLAVKTETLRNAGAHFRNDIVNGNGGKQILVDDPSGNPIELFEPPWK